MSKTLNAEKTQLQTLKRLLQASGRETAFERLSAALIGKLLDVPIFVAQTGFQHGGDAGPAGQSGRRFRIECKKYGDTTALSERELLGEINQALMRDSALEAWFLVATRAVPEQLAQSLEQYGDYVGVPIPIIDWTGPGIPPLAVLCAANPPVVEREFSEEAAKAASALAASASTAISQLKRSLESWCLGFKSLQEISHASIRAIWDSQTMSHAILNQDVAGGATPRKVTRHKVSNSLTQWWNHSAKDAPAIMVGYDGVGKTWATVDWLVASLANQPIVIVLPSSAMADIGTPSQSSMLKVLGGRLAEMTKVRDGAHWNRRLRRLLERPIAEGPALTVVFDGMNQEASLPWDRILKGLQVPPFAGKVRVIASTRTLHFGEKLASLKGLVVHPTRVDVDRYSVEAGGELDQMLQFENLTRTDISDDLLDFARTPRLFKLVVHLRNRLTNVKEITVHRLLWEYGRDSFGERSAGHSFSEAEWREWLQEIAGQVRKGINDFSQKALAGMAARADLSTTEVAARLSDILDSQFSNTTGIGEITLQPQLVAHALALALIRFLEKHSKAPFATLESQLNSWFDPITGLDQRAEILRAAVSIELERACPSGVAILGVLVTGWLQTQNIPDDHRNELLALASSIVPGLLDTVQYSTGSSQASARHWARRALRSLPKKEGPALDQIVARAVSWMSIVTMEMYPSMMADAAYKKSRQKRFSERVGRHNPGPMAVLGIPMTLEELGDETLPNTVPSLLEGYPLRLALKCFEAAAVVLAIRGQSDAWKGLKWLCQLNEVDPDETAGALRQLSNDFLNRIPEKGVATTLPSRAAGLTLCLSGIESDEKKCATLTPIADGMFDYQRDYLDDPGRSFYALERRHADMVLKDSSLSVRMRIQKCGLMLYDPTFVPPAAFVADLRTFGELFAIENVHRHSSQSVEDHLFKEIEPALARWAPDVLIELIRRNYADLKTIEPGRRYWAAYHVGDYFLVADQAASDACRDLRCAGREKDQSNENITANHLLLVELKGLGTLEQFRQVIAAGLYWISVDFGNVLGAPTAAEIDQLIEEYRHETDRQKHDLILLLSFHPCALTEKGWAWLLERLEVADADFRGVIFKFLALADAARFGRILLQREWGWDGKEKLWTNHFGSEALIAAGHSVPFDQFALRIAPWRLLEAARLRGANESEVRLAADIVDTVIDAPKIQEPDPGSNLIFHRTDEVLTPSSVDIELRPGTPDSTDPAAQLREAIDQESQISAWNRAIETAHQRIDEARANGAGLYLTVMDAEDFKPVVALAGDRVKRWLSGMESRTAEFKRRVRLSEGVFLALCEALLVFDPARGIGLWRALKECLTTRYIGHAGIDDLIHMLFRAPDSREVSQARLNLFNETATDNGLFELSLAERLNGVSVAGHALQIEDKTSAYVWRQRRSETLRGFVGVPPHFDTAIWPSGIVSTTSAQIRRDAMFMRFRESASYHWFQTFLDAPDPTDAYAAWVLFKSVADRRVRIWMYDEIEKRTNTSVLFQNKLTHLYINRNSLRSAMEKHEEGAAKKFLNQEIFVGVGPWPTDGS
jgi:hypothetical protein